MKLTLAASAIIILVSPALWKWTAGANGDRPPTRWEMTAQEHSLDSDKILFRRGILNTRLRQDLDSADSDSGPLRKSQSSQSDTHSKLRIVQLRDHIRPAWLRELKELGCRVLGYLPNNAYLIAGDSATIARVAGLDGGLAPDEQRPIKWMGSVLPGWKIDPVLDRVPAPEGTLLDVEI